MTVPWDSIFDLIVMVHDDAFRVNVGMDTKTFLTNLLLKFLLANDKARVGVFTFGTDVNRGQNQMIELSDRDNAGLLLRDIASLDVIPSGGLNIPAAVNEMIEMFNRNPRPNVAKLALLISGSFVNAVDIPLGVFNTIQNSGIRMMTLGIGSDTNELIMERLAFNPQLFYMQPEWSQLSVTERMIADINALALNETYLGDLANRPLSLSTRCSHPAGIAFLIDTSPSILPILDRVKYFIGILLSAFDLSVSDVGVIGYGTSPHDGSIPGQPNTLIPLGSIQNYAELYFTFEMKIVSSTTAQTTGTGKAIRFMRQNMFSPDYDKMKMAVVVTDGNSENPSETLTESQLARDSGIKMITFGVGADTNNLFMNELLGITGNDMEAIHSFSSDDFNDDNKLRPKLEAAGVYICDASKPPPYCSPGTYYNSNTDSCLDCERGTYQDVFNQTSCTPCHAGLTTLITGATSMDNCTDICESGKTLDGSTTCVPCGYGSYRNKTLHNLCQPCPQLFTTLTPDMSAETDMAVSASQCAPHCDPGHAWNTTATQCTPCPADTYQPDSYQYVCLPCPAGQTAPVGSTDCTAGIQICDEMMDLAIIVDNVAEISNENFNLVKSSVKNLVNSLSIGPVNTRVAIIPSVGFTNGLPIPSASIQFNDTNMSHSAVNAAIDSLVLLPMTREMVLPLTVALALFENQGREDDKIPKITLALISGGSTTLIEQAKYAGAEAKYKGIHIISVGVGQNYIDTGFPVPALEELKFLGKDVNTVFTVPAFTDLSSFDVTKTVCDVAKEYSFTTAPVSGLCLNSVDMIILLDMSGNLYNNQTWTTIALLRIVSEVFAMNDSESHIGLVSFHGDVNPNFLTLSQGVSYDNVQTAVTDQFTAGRVAGTATDEAIQKALELFTDGGRPDKPDILVTITDRPSSNPQLTMDQAQLVHDRYIYSLVVAIGTSVNNTEIAKIATNQDAILNYPSVDDLAVAPNASSEIYNNLCTSVPRCAYIPRLAFVWHLDNTDNIVAAMGMRDNLLQSFPVSTQTSAINEYVYNYGSLGAAVTQARTGLETGGSADIKSMWILSDKNATDIPGLEAAMLSARNSGIFVGVLNVNPDSNINWSNAVSGPEFFFQLGSDTALASAYVDVHESICTAEISPCNMAMDVFFIVDTTTSDGNIDANGLQLVKDFLLNLVSGLDINPAGTRVGIMQIFGILPVLLNLNQGTSLATVNAAINSLSLINATRDLSLALSFLSFEMINTAVPRIAVLITHGPSLNTTSTKFFAAVTASQGIDVISLGVGPSYSLDELEFIAKDADSVVTVPSFGQLSTLDLSGTLCTVAQSYELQIPLTGACPNSVQIVVLKDESGNINSVERNAMQTAIDNIFSSPRIDVGPAGVHVHQIPFDNTIPGSTLATVLQQGGDYLQSTSRPGLPQNIITVAFGGSTITSVLLANAETIHNNYVYSAFVELGIGPNSAEALAVATDLESILTYSSASSWNNAVSSVNSAADDLLGKICPTGNQCSNAADIAVVWDISLDITSKDVMVSALGFLQGLTASFAPNTSDTTLVFTDNNTPLDVAISNSYTWLATTGRFDVVKILLLMTDQLVGSSSALIQATDSVKASGTIVVVLNAKDPPDVLWSQVASSEEDVFQPEPFSMQYRRFILDRLCRGLCPDGFQVDGSQTTGCSECPRGTYRNVTVSYICLSCPAGTSTVTPGATSAAQCIVDCAAGTYWNAGSCVPCGPGTVQPEPDQVECITCLAGTQPSNTSTQCVDCPPGTFSVDGVICSACPDGEVQPTSGQAQCIACSVGTTPNSEKTLCGGAICTIPMDIVILVDTEQTIAPNFQAVKDFLENLVDSLSIAPDKVRVAIGPINDFTMPGDVTALNDTNLTAVTVKTAINALSPVGTTRNTASAISSAKAVLVSQGRENVSRIVFVVGAGLSDDPVDTKIKAAAAVLAGLEIAAVGIGSSAPDELVELVSKPELLFNQSGFGTLPALEVWQDLCTVAENFEEVTRPPPLDGACPNRIDFGILMDVSQSFTGLNEVKSGLISMAQILDIGPDKTRIAVLSYGNTVNEDKMLILSDPTGGSVVASKILEQLLALAPGSVMGAGLMKIIELLDASRPGIPRVLLSVTDGAPTDASDLSASAAILKKKFVYSVLVGIGLSATNPASLGPPLSDVATELDSVLLYPTADDFMMNTQPVLDAICPDVFTCDSPIDIVNIRLIQDVHVLASALNFRDQMLESFTDLIDDMVINMPDNMSLEEALNIATTHFLQDEIIAKLGALNLKKRGVSVATNRTDTTRMILFITDQVIADPSGSIAAASLAAKENGILVAAINAAEAPNNVLHNMVSTDALLFEVRKFDSPEFTTFIQKACCNAECPSGSNINENGICTLCEQGTYRDSSIDYLCQPCPEPRTTLTDGATSIDACTICPAGSEYNVTSDACVDCPPGTFKPAGIELCISCDDFLITQGSGATRPEDCVPPCEAGQEWNGATCLNCTDNFVQPEPFSPDPCQECVEPFPLATEDKTQCRSECPDGYVWNKSIADCSICPAGTYKPAPLAEECVQCPDNFTSTAGSNGCVPGGTFSLNSSSYAAQEGGSVVVVVEFTPTAPLGEIGTSLDGLGISIEYEITNGTAIAGVDFIPPTETQCVFGPNEYSKTIVIQILNDSVFESDETFFIRLIDSFALEPLGIEFSCPGEACGFGLVSPDEATATIVNTGTEPECNGQVKTHGACSFFSGNGYHCCSPPNVNYIMNVWVHNDNSLPGYSCPTEPSNWPLDPTTPAESGVPGKWSFNSTHACVVGGCKAVFKFCDEVEPMTVRFFQSSYEVPEDAGQINVEIELDLNEPFPVGFIGPNITVNIATQDGTALAGTHFVQVVNTLEIDPNTAINEIVSQTVSIPILGNNPPGVDLDFSIILTNPSSGAVIGNPSVSTVTIIAESPALTFKFSSPEYEVPENASEVQVIINLETNIPEGVSPVLGPVSVTVQTLGGTARPGVNYIAIVEDIDFTSVSGQMSKVVTIPILGNSAGQAVTFTVSLASPSTGAILGSPPTATIVIPAEEPDPCQPYIDLVIAVDLTSNYDSGDCTCLENFLFDLLDRLKLSNSRSRTGVIKFARSPLTIIRLKNGYSYKTVENLLRKHLGTSSRSDNANVCGALRMMYNMFKTDRRKAAPLKGLLIMDQTSDNTAAAVAKADLLKSKGVDLTVIGTDAAEVAALGSSSFVITDYCNMPSVDDVINTFCVEV